MECYSVDSYSDRSSTAVERRYNRGSRAGSNGNWAGTEETRTDALGDGRVEEARKDSNRTGAEVEVAAAVG